MRESNPLKPIALVHVLIKWQPKGNKEGLPRANLLESHKYVREKGSRMDRSCCRGKTVPLELAGPLL